ncbi:glycosyltransferase family protein [Leptothoe sp. PORK10 BA2]|uniref:glycosyltransferase family protein n=1 Tax=Leptothoe sp. PORK10 BA2 TaxID=3110254 RepID=UPI002B205D33|nr:glycosyltransferase [Leptothoe sp. PORK10 BA2]MEA5466830.1 glycosyltransferase [Leptothoe sp. PORK10 BA2]
MQKIMFYCQHILGMGHLIRSMEIVRGLTADFEVCFINGGEVVQGFQAPPGVQVINLPAIKTDTEFRALIPVNSTLTIEETQDIRRQKLLDILHSFRPDVLVIELFPFGRRRFSFELIPLIEAAKAQNAKVVSSLRDIVVTKKDQARHEAKIVRLINQYFDQLLIHGDPELHPLEDSFSRVDDLNCDVRYTGYVVQQHENNQHTIADAIALGKKEPLILVSIGGGRFGHELLDCVIQAAAILESKIPHRIQIFTGPFMPDDKFWALKNAAKDCRNLYIRRYTPTLLSYMQRAELSISMSGYNTTMNILTTGVRALMLPFTGNDDQEQTMRVERLSQLGKVRRIQPEDLQPERFAAAVTEHLQHTPSQIEFDLNGVTKTVQSIKALLEGKLDAGSLSKRRTTASRAA